MNLERIYNQYSEMLFRLSYSMLQSREDAEDVLQDVFVKILSRPFDFNSAEHERAWLVRVTLNRCHDVLRKKKIRRYTPLEDIVSLPAEEKDMSILREVQALPSDKREVVLLRYFEDFSVQEIAEILHITPSAVKMRLARARELLKEILNYEE